MIARANWQRLGQPVLHYWNAYCQFAIAAPLAVIVFFAAIFLPLFLIPQVYEVVFLFGPFFAGSIAFGVLSYAFWRGLLGAKRPLGLRSPEMWR